MNELRAWASNKDMARRGDWNRLVDCFLVARETCLVRQGNTCTQSGAKRRKAARRDTQRPGSGPPLVRQRGGTADGVRDKGDADYVRQSHGP